ncbi:hypothetical protein [Nocardiopsis metallicus]|uniref:O-antigen/teichoic acid export membrane protein n=1 Tax=Nocardiopsis metallicus TaxID=179819 RepID=A0A840WDK7_9ACTN|nr:hypothetical protein [Nocardiopsis metallicus]MBB5495090.1 O-antigen/teichoic acid export membrane protein [Nocardiopsis metallicus]
MSGARASGRGGRLYVFAGVPFVGVVSLLFVPRMDTLFGGDEQAPALVVAAMSGWLSRVVNLLVVEWWIQYRKSGRGAWRGVSTVRPARPAAM